MGKVEIVVDADVLIHFSKGGCLFLLPKIFPEYDYVVLDTVYNEAKTIRAEIDNVCRVFKSIKVMPFSPTGEMLREYAKLTRTFGRGESACMSYCRFTHNVIGSSNLRDIRKYCEENKITYLTTMDFFYYAWKRNVMKEETINMAIKEIVMKGSKLPQIEIANYLPSVVI